MNAISPLRRRYGFSLLELVFVMCVIGTLVMVLVPGIMRAREAARRTMCSNNLKEIGLALVNYHDVHGVFPPGYVARNVSPTSPGDRETGPGFAWGTLVLPMLDQNPLYQTIDFSEDAGFSGATGTAVTVFQCPSITTRQPSCYVGSAGFGNLTDRPGMPTIPGILYRNSNVPDFDIRDGASNTFLAGERADVHDFVPGEPPVRAGAEWFSVPPWAVRPAGLSDPQLDEGPASLVLGTVGQDEPVPVHAPPLQTNHVGAFSSRHPGGVNMVMADGSVHFVTSEIDYELYRALGGRKDGQTGTVPTEF